MNRDLTVFEGEMCGDLGLDGRMICKGILQNLKSKIVETWA